MNSLSYYNVMILQDVRQYSFFSEMLEIEGIAKVLPGVERVEEGENFILGYSVLSFTFEV